LTTAPRPAGLNERIQIAVDQVRRRDLLVTNSFWTVFHGILGQGPTATLLNPETGQRISALDYICIGGELRGLRFIPTATGLDVQTGPLFVGQGHQDQFVAEMAQWGLPPDQKFLVNGQAFSFMDFIRHSQARVRVTADQELSWTILCIGQYLGTDGSWTNSAGEPLRFEDLVRYEVRAPIETAACGGTHRLFGLTWVHHLHLLHGGQEVGVWKEVADRIARYQQLARQWQHADGSFSTSFFRGPGHAADPQLRINTTGHTLEWLALSLPNAELHQAWVEAAANALALMLLDAKDSAVESGSLYHAVHGLRLYQRRAIDRHEPGSAEGPLPLDPLRTGAPSPATAR
jgi:hypothetical protein